MTALDPVASRSLDRTGVCRESRGAPSAPGLVSGLGLRSPNRPDKGRDPTDRAGSRRELWCERPSCCHRRQLGEPSGESRFIVFFRPPDRIKLCTLHLDRGALAMCPSTGSTPPPHPGGRAGGPAVDNVEKPLCLYGEGPILRSNCGKPWA